MMPGLEHIKNTTMNDSIDCHPPKEYSIGINLKTCPTYSNTSSSLKVK